MKNYISLSLISFFILSTSCVLAGTTSLSTNYPPPTAAYNKVKLATNATVAYTSGTVTSGPGCPGTITANPPTVFTDNTGTLYECYLVSGSPTTAPYCSIRNAANTAYLNNGAILADSNGSLHVCMKGVSASYPQECYNSFCTPSAANDNCYNYMNQTQLSSYSATCQNGFIRQYLDTKNNIYESFNTANGTTVYSATCCSGVTIQASGTAKLTGGANTTLLGAGTSPP